MAYNYLDDLTGITDLRELGGTAVYNDTAFSGYRIRISDDGDRVFYQRLYVNNLSDIKVADIEYFDGSPDILDILNMTADEFENYFGGFAPGIWIDGEIYLLSEFMREL